MTYELAKQLKDTGFPITEKADRLSPERTYHTNNLEYAYHPTLEELISACGEQFWKLIKDDAYGNWAAISPRNSQHVALGETPSEAVSRLWLALNAS